MRESIRVVPFTSSVRHQRVIITGGLFLIALGLLVVIVSPIANLAVTVALGWLFSASGLVGLITTFAARRVPGFWWPLLSALLALGIGIILIEWRVDSAPLMTNLLISFFVIAGFAIIIFAITHKHQCSGRWEWITASGIVDLALAAFVITGLPETAKLALGILVGINMLFIGSAFIATAIYGQFTARIPRSTKGFRESV